MAVFKHIMAIYDGVQGLTLRSVDHKFNKFIITHRKEALNNLKMSSIKSPTSTVPRSVIGGYA